MYTLTLLVSEERVCYTKKNKMLYKFFVCFIYVQQNNM